MEFHFGNGSLFAAATQDAQGNTLALPSYIKFGVLQDVSFDFERDVKELYGQNALPVALAGGKMKVGAKAKLAQISGRIFNDLFIGGTITGGQTALYDDLVGSAIPTASPYTITPTVPSGGTLDKILAVLDASGLPMTRVASTPATGQFSLSAGVLTFAAADAGKTAYISYTYTLPASAAPTSKTIAWGNPLMGTLPTFGMEFGTSLNGKKAFFRFPYCASGKFSFDPKQDDYTTNDVEIKVFADPVSGNLGTISYSE